MPKYLVGYSFDAFGDQGFVIVNASSEDEAIKKFIQGVGIAEDAFLEYVHEKSISLSFAETFWIQIEEEMDHFEQSGEALIDEEEFKHRVREFFGEHSDFAEAFLDYYYSDEEERPATPFPTEMLLYIWFESGWGDEILVIPLGDIEEI